MPTAALTFELVPDATQVSFGSLERSLAQIRRLVREVDFAVTREKTRVWVVEKLHSSNPTITVKPMLNTQGVIDVIAAGIQVATTGSDAALPQTFPVEGLHRLRSMRGLFTGRRERLQRIRCKVIDDSLLEGGLQEEEIEQAPEVGVIDASIEEKVDRILRRGYYMLGSIEGQLDAINLHGATTVTIWDRVTGQPVRCYFDRDNKEQMKGLLERTVLIAGRIRYYANGQLQSITEITDLRDLTPSGERPDVRFGSIPDYLTGGQDSVDYVRGLREA